jgi:hypothetical protein
MGARSASTVERRSPRARLGRVYADLNGDGDALDPYEAQPAIHTDTLKTEIADPAGEDTDTDGIAAGEAIHAHFRIGL